MIIDGKKIAQEIKTRIKDKVKRYKIKPGLAVVLVGGDPASEIYVKAKEKACHEVGFYSEKIVLPEDVTQKKLNDIVIGLNSNEKIHGILVQFPLPKHLSENKVIGIIDPAKDVDCCHPFNIGRLVAKKTINYSTDLIPCTPKGIIKLIKTTDVNISGKKVTVVGRSNLVGKPVSWLMLGASATVTVCHSQTTDLIMETKEADILIVAVGKPNLITRGMVKKGAIVIDAGITRTGKKIIGDVDFNSIKDIAGYITPVPGGVGPMTIAMLLENTLIAYRNQLSFS